MRTGDIVGGNYRLVERVGEGAYGVVYRAEPLRGARGMVAVKVFSQDTNEQEMAMLEELEHPNILRYRATLEHEGKLCLVTDFADGGSLEELLRAYPRGLTSEQVNGIVLSIARALVYLHERNIVHRDVKPANILMVSTRDGSHNRVCLADVGIAKALEATTGAHTGAHSMAYAAPELFRGQVCLKSDVYALGVTAYELLTGRLPFLGTLAEVMFGHLEKPIPQHPTINKDWMSILDRMLKKDQSQRPSALELVILMSHMTFPNHSGPPVHPSAAGLPLPTDAWDRLLKQVRDRSVPMAALLEQQAAIDRWEANGAVVILIGRPFKDTFERLTARKKVLADAIENVFGPSTYPVLVVHPNPKGRAE